MKPKPNEFSYMRFVWSYAPPRSLSGTTQKFNRTEEKKREREINIKQLKVAFSIIIIHDKMAGKIFGILYCLYMAEPAVTTIKIMSERRIFPLLECSLALC